MLHRISVISRHKAPVPLYKESSSDGTLNDIDGVVRGALRTERSL